METRQYEHSTNRAPLPEIGGRTWLPCGQGVFKRAVAPGRKPPAEAQVVTPDPVRVGWKIAWLFLGGLVALIIGSPWIAKLAGIAVIALPLWVLR